ncbi:hypothetical protein GGTG_02511 [Gaeumannomyces tritici R3-111a-1]|uniref:Adiponectin receptor protein 1 n=1 Tax=Gaeumannomyces tritici (strain R3-111a-1) TaxID=644352 RepID=J3NMK5_GAET3|nr:hypothetical protein GGTG_02511 [Gaeumannomyces tritici R3-111a-1]EJT82538.1 hypothetical protein GGTG_02511 [Gaeumannomyces tritici R3-111a-1]
MADGTATRQPRVRAAASNGAHNDDTPSPRRTPRRKMRTTARTAAAKTDRLLINSRVPAWYSQPLIRTGYRPGTNFVGGLPAHAGRQAAAAQPDGQHLHAACPGSCLRRAAPPPPPFPPGPAPPGAVDGGRQTGLSYYYAEGLLVLLGAWHFDSRFPECWKPGRFDILGASHQIFHVLIVASSVVHLCGLVSALRYNHENARCPLLELGM